MAGQRHKSYDERLYDLRISSTTHRRTHSDPTKTFKIANRLSGMKRGELFTLKQHGAAMDTVQDRSTTNHWGDSTREPAKRKFGNYYRFRWIQRSFERLLDGGILTAETVTFRCENKTYLLSDTSPDTEPFRSKRTHKVLETTNTSRKNPNLDARRMVAKFRHVHDELN